MTCARDLLRKVHALGGRIECNGEHLKLSAGRRAIPEPLVEEIRAAKAELTKLLTPGFRANRDDEHLRGRTASKDAESLAFCEDAQVNTFDGHLRQNDEHLRDCDERLRQEQQKSWAFDEKRGQEAQVSAPKVLTEDAHLSIFAGSRHSCGFGAPETPKVLIIPTCSEGAQFGVAADNPTADVSGRRVLLRDGRCLRRLRAGEIPAKGSVDAAALLDDGRRRDLVFVADGNELVVIGRHTPSRLLEEIALVSGAIIAELRTEARERPGWLVFDPKYH